MRVVKEAYADPTQYELGEYHEPKATPEKPYWYQVDVGYGTPFVKLVMRDELKANAALNGMLLWKYGRLSVTPVTPDEWKTICAMGGL